MIGLRSEMDAERGQAVIDCMCLDDDVLHALGAALQLSSAVMTKPPTRLLELLKRGPGNHLKKHQYKYQCMLDAELALIKRLKELQLRAVALLGTALLSCMVGLANFFSQWVYDDVYGN